MTSRYSPEARDAGLRKLTLMRRWLIAGSVALTGVFTAVAAHAFPGKNGSARGVQTSSKGRSSALSASSASASTGEDSEGSSGSLSPPAQVPQSAETQESSSGEGGEPAQQATEAPVVSGGS